jgi:hypothetical protein
MNLIKIFIIFLILQNPIAWAQQNNGKPQVPTNVTPVSPTNQGVNTTANKGTSVIQDPNQAQGATKKEKTEQILIDPFSGSASTASIDVNTNPDLANFVDQTLVGIIIGETKRVAIMQSAQGQINRFKRSDKINSEYKILEIQKDKILVSSLDNNEYEVYFNNIIKPIERKKAPTKKPVKLEQQIEDSSDQNVDPLAPKLAPKKDTPTKKKAESKVNSKKIKKTEPALIEDKINQEETPTKKDQTLINDKEEVVIKEKMSSEIIEENISLKSEDKLDQKLELEEDSAKPNIEPTTPEVKPKKQSSLKKATETKTGTKKTANKNINTSIKEKAASRDSEEEEKRQIKLIQEEEKKIQDSLNKTNEKNIKKEKEEIDDSYKPDLEPKVIREDSDLNKSSMQMVNEVNVKPFKKELKR